MSAFIVSPSHIQSIVGWAINHDALPYHVTPEELAECLAKANIASVEYRYPDLVGTSAKAFLSLDSNEEYLKECSQTYRGKLSSAVGLLKFLNCLEYQCCEPQNWQESGAYRRINQLRAAASRALPGYDSLPWEG